MYLMKSTKTFLALVFLFGPAACSFWQTAQDANSNTPPVSEEIKTGIPFESKEPETFQTDIVVTNFLNGEKTEKNYFAARLGNKSLTVFNAGEKNENSILIDGGRKVFIDKENKIFRETENTLNGSSAADDTLEFLTTEWLSRKTEASFENLGTENNLTNYRVRLENSSLSEVILTYDENLKLPVKQEFYSISNERKILTMTVELKNFQTSADEKLFVLPQDYKRVETR